MREVQYYWKVDVRVLQLIIRCACFAGCGKTHFWELASEITSPHYPDNYDDELRCNYYIHNPFNNLMIITFHEFDLEYVRECGFDYLMVSVIVLSSLFFNLLSACNDTVHGYFLL